MSRQGSPGWALLAGIAGVLALFFAASGVWLDHELARARGELASCRKQLALQQREAGRLEAEAAELHRGLADQDEAVQRWREEAEAQADKVAAAAERAAEIRTATRAQVARTMAGWTPEAKRGAGAGDCEGALRWGLQQAAQLGRDWEGGR